MSIVDGSSSTVPAQSAAPGDVLPGLLVQSPVAGGTESYSSECGPAGGQVLADAEERVHAGRRLIDRLCPCKRSSVMVSYNTDRRTPATIDDPETAPARMDRDWNDSQPIYRQLHARIVAMILDGVLKEGAPLPSVRSVAAEYRINPLTVLKGYQQLVDEELVEMKRGRGMFINPGARERLLRAEREKFMKEEWPKIHATIQRLGLDAEELLHPPRPARRSRATP